MRRASEIDYTVVDDAMRARCPPRSYPVVATLRNDLAEEMLVWLEQWPQMLVLAPGHEVALLARPVPGLRKARVYGRGARRSVHAGNVADPDWHVLFKGCLIRLAYRTILAELEDIEGDFTALPPERWQDRPRSDPAPVPVGAPPPPLIRPRAASSRGTAASRIPGGSAARSRRGRGT